MGVLVFLFAVIPALIIGLLAALISIVNDKENMKKFFGNFIVWTTLSGAAIFIYFIFELRKN